MSRQKRQKVSDSGASIITSAANIDLTTEAVANVIRGGKTQQLPLQRRSLFVRSLLPTATTESLTEHFSQSYPLKHALVVVDPATKQSKGYGFVTFADAEDAQKAKADFNGSLFQGRKIKVEIAEPRHREIDQSGVNGSTKSKPAAATIAAKADRERQRTEGQKPPKLIIRNLPWTIKKPEQLAALFRSYGKVKHATIPTTKPGLQAGFGFVVLRGRKNAEKALEGVNGKEVDGRTLAVDWAVDKEVWETLQKGEDGGELSHQEANDTAEIDDASTVKSEDGDDFKLDEVALSDTDHDDLSISDKSDVFKNDEDGEVKPRRIQDSSATLFIRNLPFNSTDEALQEHFALFGPVRYARVVLDHDTGRSKGTGFVCFYKKEDADECLREAPRSEQTSSQGNVKTNFTATSGVKHSLLEDPYADHSGRYTVDGRVLQVTRAVDRNEAMRLTIAGSSLRETRDKDKRRLYLLSEGTIPSNSPIYDTLAPSEIKMREDSAKQRQALIKSNPALHISLTRLSVRNIPRNITSKELKAFAREAVVGFAKDVKEGVRRQLSKEELSRGGDEMKEVERLRKSKGKGIVKQAKIVFEGREGSKVAEDSGAGRSRGYGFIEYVSHRWALMGLRWLNGHAVGHQLKGPEGNPSSRKDVQEKKRRLIVEFAIENAQVVGRRQDREVKAQERSKMVTGKKEKGEFVETSKKVLTKGTLMAKSRKDLKRKRDSNTKREQGLVTDSTSSGDKGDAVPRGSDKLAKGQQIIARKRAMRRARKVLRG
ncbi:RNA recognition motif-containing protein [Lignoscripta atroalba]|nr:RNA recognition motif-containing protein [Lignoscripta atroalba]